MLIAYLVFSALCIVTATLGIPLVAVVAGVAAALIVWRLEIRALAARAKQAPKPRSSGPVPDAAV